MQSIENQNKAL